MIESCYWKEELVRIASSVAPVKSPPRWTERLHCTVERDLMIGFFILRRLIELHKVSTTTAKRMITVYSYPASGKDFDRWLGPDLEKHYRLDCERKESKSGLYLSNQFIHSIVSYVARDETRNWSDVLTVSDYDSKHCIWRVPIESIRELFMVASNDYPHTVTMRHNPKTKDYEIETN